MKINFNYIAIATIHVDMTCLLMNSISIFEKTSSVLFYLCNPKFYTNEDVAQIYCIYSLVGCFYLINCKWIVGEWRRYSVLYSFLLACLFLLFNLLLYLSSALEEKFLDERQTFGDRRHSTPLTICFRKKIHQVLIDYFEYSFWKWVCKKLRDNSKWLIPFWSIVSLLESLWLLKYLSFVLQ